MTTIAELLHDGSCSPQCLVADARSACGCRCIGEYHGVLAAATIGDPADGTLERTDALTTTTT